MKILPILLFTTIESNRPKREPLKSLTCKHDRDTINVGQRKYIESQHYPRKSTADKFCRWTLQDRSFSLLLANFANSKFKKTYFEYGIYGINYLNIPFCNFKI